MTTSGEGSAPDRVGELLHDALELPTEERRGFIDLACAGDPVLRAEVTSLLEHAHRGDDFFTALGAAISSQAGVDGDPEPGAIVDAYRVAERLGGGVTSVYRAVDTRTGESVALKFGGSSAGNMSASDVDMRMRVEGRVLQRLTHPAICGLLGTGSTAAGRQYLVLEYIDGEPLHHIIPDRLLSPGVVAAGAMGIASALHEAHTLRIIHRDLKPANIMLDRADTLRVLDFGAAKTEDADLTAPGHTIGTLDYMSPEQLQGEEVRAETDIWSLSIALWEALTGVHPFRGTNRRETLSAISEAAFRTPTSSAPTPFEEALLDLFRSGLNREPRARPTAAEFSERAMRIHMINGSPTDPHR